MSDLARESEDRIAEQLEKQSTQKKARYLHVDAHDCLKLLDAIASVGGNVLAINPSSAMPGKAPSRREIWFMAGVDEREVCQVAGVPYH